VDSRVQRRVQSGGSMAAKPLSPVASLANVSPAFTNVNPLNMGESLSAPFSLSLSVRWVLLCRLEGFVYPLYVQKRACGTNRCTPISPGSVHRHRNLVDRVVHLVGL